MPELLLTPNRLANILEEVLKHMSIQYHDTGNEDMLGMIIAKLRVGQCEATSGHYRCQMYADHVESHHAEDSLGSVTW